MPPQVQLWHIAAGRLSSFLVFEYLNDLTQGSPLENSGYQLITQPPGLSLDKPTEVIESSNAGLESFGLRVP